jgi:DNA-binding transcriptional ArsR family regulator
MDLLTEERIDAIFKALADPTRRKIVGIILNGGTMVTDLVVECQMPQPTVSKHLKILKDAGIVRSEKDGVRRIYRLAPFSAETTLMLDWLEMVKRYGNY